MILATIDLNHVRGPEYAESRWLAANGLDISMIPVAQVATIERNVEGDESALEMIHVMSSLKDAAGKTLMSRNEVVKVPVSVRLTAQLEDFLTTPIQGA